MYLSRSSCSKPADPSDDRVCPLSGPVLTGLATRPSSSPMELRLMLSKDSSDSPSSSCGVNSECRPTSGSLSTTVASSPSLSASSPRCASTTSIEKDIGRESRVHRRLTSVTKLYGRQDCSCWRWIVQVCCTDHYLQQTGTRFSAAYAWGVHAHDPASQDPPRAWTAGPAAACTPLHPMHRSALAFIDSVHVHV